VSGSWNALYRISYTLPGAHGPRIARQKGTAIIRAAGGAQKHCAGRKRATRQTRAPLDMDRARSRRQRQRAGRDQRSTSASSTSRQCTRLSGTALPLRSMCVWLSQWKRRRAAASTGSGLGRRCGCLRQRRHRRRHRRRRKRRVEGVEQRARNSSHRRHRWLHVLRDGCHVRLRRWPWCRCRRRRRRHSHCWRRRCDGCGRRRCYERRGRLRDRRLERRVSRLLLGHRRSGRRRRCRRRRCCCCCRLLHAGWQRRRRRRRRLVRRCARRPRLLCGRRLVALGVALGVALDLALDLAPDLAPEVAPEVAPVALLGLAARSRDSLGRGGDCLRVCRGEPLGRLWLPEAELGVQLGPTGRVPAVS